MEILKSNDEGTKRMVQQYMEDFRKHLSISRDNNDFKASGKT